MVGRFLYHKTSPEYLYYESRLLELEGGKRSSVGPGFPAAPPQLRPAPASAQQPPQPAVPPPPRVNRFSETKPEGEQHVASDGLFESFFCPFIMLSAVTVSIGAPGKRSK